MVMIRAQGRSVIEPAPFGRDGVNTDKAEEMTDPTPEELLDALRERVKREPGNLGLRFELGERLMVSGNYGEAVPHLQIATRNPRLRQATLNLLKERFGLEDLP